MQPYNKNTNLNNNCNKNMNTVVQLWPNGYGNGLEKYQHS